MTLLKLIASDSFITVNKELVKKVGLEEAIILGELVSELDYWTKNNGLTEDGYFFSTIENIEEKTTLSGHKQRNAINTLKELGLVDCKVKGLPAKRYIKIFANAILKILNSDEVVEEPKKAETYNRKREVPEELKPEVKPAKEEPKAKKTSRKDQLTEYINRLDFNVDTKDNLFKWIFNIGLPKGITVEQLKDKLKTLDDLCNGDENLMNESIKNAYLNGYFGFFKPNNATYHQTNKKPSPTATKATEYYANQIKNQSSEDRAQSQADMRAFYSSGREINTTVSSNTTTHRRPDGSVLELSPEEF